MLRFRFVLTLSLVIFLATPIHTFAIAMDDLDHITIEGAVTDADGRMISGARVVARHLSTGQERTAVSDQGGRYRLTSLPPGDYEVRAERDGFQIIRYTVNGVAGYTLSRNFTLEASAITEKITVDSGSEQKLVDTSRTVIGGTLSKREIDELPNDSRNIFDLITLFSGASFPAFSENGLAEGDTKDRFRSSPEEAGIFALNGGLPFSNNLTIEGLDNNDDRAARERFIPTADAVDEFQVISNS
ncbi:MAG TPA: carboxypeptidase-like regulatory domain-containing protein [Blastocatellia bacterium]|nr:carboxypeptidase-like regulatory domain-containing protein [Blastocatellia bacterium]